MDVKTTLCAYRNLLTQNNVWMSIQRFFERYAIDIETTFCVLPGLDMIDFHSDQIIQ